MKLYFRRLAIYYKNHIDAFAMIFATLALVVFTLAIYTYTPLNRLIVQPRWPWAQAESDTLAPLTMIQFFACLASMLGVVALMNYRSGKKLFMKIVFYAFSAIQIINDIFYLYEINRHIDGLMDTGEWYTIAGQPHVNEGIAFTVVHLSLLVISVLILILAPYIQAKTSKIKLKGATALSNDLVIDENEVEIEEENSLKKNEYGYNLDELDDDFINDVINGKK